MREIKFRGMDIKGNWYYGLLSNQTDKGWRISNSVGMPLAYEVRPDTIGQFTGLKDKNGKEIYEGDILDMLPEREKNKIYDFIIFSEGCFCLGRAMMNYELTYGLGDGIVVGNIYENKELLS